MNVLSFDYLQRRKRVERAIEQSTEQEREREGGGENKANQQHTYWIDYLKIFGFCKMCCHFYDFLLYFFNF